MLSNCYRPRNGAAVLALFSTYLFTASVAFVPSPSICLHNCPTASFPPLHQQWDGEVVPDGKIQGCRIENVGLTEWAVHIDGVEADLGAFSQAIYKKILMDAKQQRFQGFRPGTIPPQLEPTYRSFCMDECAREKTMEALQQNNVKPFERCRLEMSIEDVSIPPPIRKRKKKSKKKRSQEEATSDSLPEVPEWKTYPTMKEAIDGGWKPGQSFSFRASNVKGQKLETESGQTVSLFGKDE